MEVDYAFTMTNLETGDSGLEHHTESCDTWSCHDNFTYASPCTEYRLELNATYIELGVKEEVMYRVRQAYTEEEVSSRPRDFNVTEQDQSSIGLQWEEPASHTSCLSHYRVCWKVVPARITANCTTTNTTTLTLSNLAACTLYQVVLTAVTSGGFESPPKSSWKPAPCLTILVQWRTLGWLRWGRTTSPWSGTSHLSILLACWDTLSSVTKTALISETRETKTEFLFHPQIPTQSQGFTLAQTTSARWSQWALVIGSRSL